MNNSRFEKTKFHFNVEKLVQELHDFILPLKPESRLGHSDSWSLLSSNGDYADGFQMQLPPYNGPMNWSPRWQPADPKLRSLKTMQDYCIPTQICRGHFREILEELDSHGLWPRRARVIKLRAGTKTNFHVDCPKGDYAARLHLPIITNDGCFFDYDNESLHMPADGSSHLVDVSCSHRARNEGMQDRFHLIICIWDTKGITEKYKFQSTVPLPERSLQFPLSSVG